MSIKKLEEAVQFWLNYISDWEESFNEPAPDHARLSFTKAVSKLEKNYSTVYQLMFCTNHQHTIH